MQTKNQKWVCTAHAFLQIHEKKIVILLAFLLVTLKCIIAGAQSPTIYAGAGHDDALFYKLSLSLLGGDWLGQYGQLTLAKGIVLPLWVCIANFFSVPILVANQALYAFACWLMMRAIAPLVQNAYHHLFVFAVLFFNPATMSVQMLRLHRDAIYPALCLIFFAGFIGMFLHRNSAKLFLGYAIWAGVGFWAAWNAREDGIWLLPFAVAACLIIVLYLLLDKTVQPFHKKGISLLCVALPLCLLLVGNGVLSSINYVHYGRFVVNDYMSRDFQMAYGALTRVTHENWVPDIPVPEDAREKIYEVSPAFSEIRGPLEDSFFKMQIEDARMDFRGGWFFWAVRDAVAQLGYYENAAKAQEYYVRLASEVNAACDSGLLPSSAGKRATLMPPFRREYIVPMLQKTADGVAMTVGFQQLTFAPIESDTTTKWLDLIHSAPYVDPNAFTHQKLTLIGRINKLYQVFSPVLFCLGLLSFAGLVGLLLREWRRGQTISLLPQLIVAGAFLLLTVLRIAMLAFVHVSSFYAVDPLYLSSAYPLALLFGLLSTSFFVLNLKQTFCKKEKKDA